MTLYLNILQAMKKIVFVEKEQGSYDPVVNYFNKKNMTVNTPHKTGAFNTNTNSNLRSNTSKKVPSRPSQTEKIPVPKKQETPKVPSKEQCILPPPKPQNIREQTNKSRDIGKRNVKKDSKTSVLNKLSQKDLSKVSNTVEEFKQDSLQKESITESQKLKPKNETNTNVSKGGDLVKRINELQLRQQQYIRKIEDLEAKEEKYVKNQQKLSKIQKDYKAALQRSKEAEGVLQKLKDKDNQIKQLMDGKAIPFSRKREVILSNKIRQLKRVNRQLVARLKNYKGNDLTEMSIQQNREQIMKELYTVDVEKQLNQQMNIEMQSLLTQLSHKLHQYIQKRVKNKGEKMQWAQQQNQLLDLTQLAQKISLNYLDKYQICPLPQSNQEAASVYSIIEQYKHNNHMQKAIDRYNLNMEISKQNAQIIDHIHNIEQQMTSIRTQIGKPKKKQTGKNKNANLLKIYQRRLNFIQNLLIQNICHQQNIKQWIEKTHGKVSEQLKKISATIAQIRDIVAVGQSAKQSLYLYLSTNIAQLMPKFPNLKLSLKQIKSSFSELQHCCQSNSK